ncbi:unnamed protein product [Brassica rapa]|uniref:V-type proton ATPase proteolipid subunit n=1 Tax=Brassica campestris TaxID=3711 RepID=A0A3P6A407_BRACM|nr:unnamed protein product [Brassica rapa]VDC83965.1 unnamed protein product [Brassica rapa]
MSTFSGDESARFFGFIGAAAALKFRLWIGPMKLTDLHIPLIGFDLTLAIFSQLSVSFSDSRLGIGRPGPKHVLEAHLHRARMGAAYGTAKSGVGVASMGVMRPELVMQSIVPVVMAGVLGIYGLIIAVIISTGINPTAKSYYLFETNFFSKK